MSFDSTEDGVEKMLTKVDRQNIQSGVPESGHDAGDLTGMREEIRILLPASQMLTAFLILLPFNQSFSEIRQSERWIYLATFIASMISLVCFSAPAAQHRLQRPLRNRVRFKSFATRIIIVGMIALSVALTLAAELVVSRTFGHRLGVVVAALVMLLIGILWWLLPLLRKERE